MKVAGRPFHRHLTAGDTTQAVTHGGDSLCDHAGIGDSDDIALELVLMLLQKRHQVRAADFLFAFKEEDQVYRQHAVLVNCFLHPKNVSEHLALVIGGAACPYSAVTDFRFKGW